MWTGFVFCGMQCKQRFWQVCVAGDDGTFDLLAHYYSDVARFSPRVEFALCAASWSPGAVYLSPLLCTSPSIHVSLSAHVDTGGAKYRSLWVQMHTDQRGGGGGKTDFTC
jgi:hypothetical protein